MTFLAPLAGLLAGVLGLGGLLLLHALKLRRQPLRISSTLLWKNAAQDLEVNTPFRRPRFTLLLILQALAVLLLALAIARPVLGGARGQLGRVVLVIDQTASMRAITSDGGTRFDKAIESAIDRVNALRRSEQTPEIAVVGFAHRCTLVSPPTRSIGDTLAAIRSIAPTDQPGDTQELRELLASLDETSAIAADQGSVDTPENETREASANSTLWIFTDAGSITERDFIGQRGELIVPDTNGPANLGIAALHASRDPDSPGIAGVFLRVVSNAERPVGVIATIETAEARIRVPLQITASTDETPGSLTRTIEIDAPGERRITVTLDHQGRPDALSADDTAWVTIPDARPPRTVVFAPDAVADSFLMDVVQALAPNAFSVHRPTDLDAIRGAELVIYDRVTPASLPPAPTLGFGSGWPTGTTNTNPNPQTQRERIVAWERAHPVLRDITLAPIVFDRAIQLPDATSPGVTVLAESSVGPVFTETVAGGNRHIRVAFPLERSNWGVEVGMSIFVAKVFERLAPGTRGEGSVITTTQSFSVPANAPRVEAIGPATLSAPVTELGIASLGPAPLAGVYQLNGSPQRDTAVSMLNTAESTLQTGPSAQFGGTSPNTVNADARISGIGRRELWPLALIAALVLMTAEFFVHAARARV